MTDHRRACPIAKIADLLSDPWTMLIIRDLLRSPMRFSELERSLTSVSSRTLALKLKRLLDEKIIAKSGMRYSITPQGKKLSRVIKAMAACGKQFA